MLKHNQTFIFGCFFAVVKKVIELVKLCNKNWIKLNRQTCLRFLRLSSTKQFFSWRPAISRPLLASTSASRRTFRPVGPGGKGRASFDVTPFSFLEGSFARVRVSTVGQLSKVETALAASGSVTPSTGDTAYGPCGPGTQTLNFKFRKWFYKNEFGITCN
jgi:hypothetical protein